MNNTGKPLVSVVMPVYNGEKFIAETITTILGQTYAELELIIVNDGSVDSTAEVVSGFTDQRLIVCNLPRNQGVSHARNAGSELARGEYLAFCDSDDLYMPDKLQTQIEYLLSHPAVDVCSTYFTLLDGGEERIISYPLTDQEIKSYFFSGNCFCGAGVVGKTTVFRRFKYTAGLKVAQDYDLWTRMANGGVVFANVPRPLMKYRMHPTQASRNNVDLVHSNSENIRKNYTLAFLGDPLIAEHADKTAISLGDFREFMSRLAGVCADKEVDMNLFRPLIAGQYKKLRSLSLWSFITFMGLASRYRLEFPAKYLLNIFIKGMLPLDRNSSLFETLTKLKIYLPPQC